jgi:hypothetical protein
MFLAGLQQTTCRLIMVAIRNLPESCSGMHVSVGCLLSESCCTSVFKPAEALSTTSIRIALPIVLRLAAHITVDE